MPVPMPSFSALNAALDSKTPISVDKLVENAWSNPQNYSPVPPFDSIAEALDKKEKRRKGFWWILSDAAVVLLLVGAVVLGISVKKESNKLAGNSEQKQSTVNNSISKDNTKTDAKVENNNAADLKNTKQMENPASTSTAGVPKTSQTPERTSSSTGNSGKPNIAPSNNTVDGATIPSLNYPYYLKAKTEVKLNTNFKLPDLVTENTEIAIKPNTPKDNLEKTLSALRTTALFGAGFTQMNYSINQDLKQYVSKNYLNNVQKSEKIVGAVYGQLRFSYPLTKSKKLFVTGGFGLGQRSVQMNFNHEVGVLNLNQQAGVSKDVFGNYPILSEFGGGKRFVFTQNNKFTNIDIPFGINYHFKYKNWEFVPGVEGVFTKTFAYNAGILNTQKMNEIYTWNKTISSKSQLGYGFNLNSGYEISKTVQWNVMLQHNRWVNNALGANNPLTIKPRFTAISTGLTWRFYH